jgi:hypothetical protein
MKAYGGVNVWNHISLTSALAGGEWSAWRSGHFTPGERALPTRCIRGWMYPRAGMDYVEKREFLILPGLELRPLDGLARSQSLYRLRYPGSNIKNNNFTCYFVCAWSWTSLIKGTFENGLLEKIIYPKTEEVTSGWRKLFNEACRSLYFSPDIITKTQWRTMRWIGHVTRMESWRMHI